MSDETTATVVSLRCGFCLEINEVDLSTATNRPACTACSKPMLLDRPVKVAQEDFECTVLEAKVPVLVDFYADWCAPCKMVAPLMDEVAQQQMGKMLVVKIDTDASQDIAMRYEIRSIPTIIVFAGGEEVERSLGFEPERVRDFVEKAVA